MTMLTSDNSSDFLHTLPTPVVSFMLKNSDEAAFFSTASFIYCGLSHIPLQYLHSGQSAGKVVVEIPDINKSHL